MINYIPNKLKIGNIDYKIDVVENDIVIDGKSNYSGCISYDESNIKILSKLCKQKKLETLWHEILHGITEHFNIDLKNDDEEKIIDCIAKGVFQVLQDNKEVIKDE